jgi:hypothetical protein
VTIQELRGSRTLRRFPVLILKIARTCLLLYNFRIGDNPVQILLDP